MFLDWHSMGCDEEFFITEIPFGTFTRDRTDGEIHLLVTTLATGAGRTQYTVTFIGPNRFAGRADTIVTNLPLRMLWPRDFGFFMKPSSLQAKQSSH